MNDTLRSLLEGDLSAYKSIPFWSWNNCLDIPELLRQIDDMHTAGIGGFIMHARLGLSDEYLGEKWFTCVGACLERARELGMQAWIYDENGWPSGFVGGKLLEKEAFRARYLEYSTGSFDASAFAVFVADDAVGFRRVELPLAGTAEYHNVYLRVSPANTDILNLAVVDAFIRETHEAYYRRFAPSFGRELAGFFTDEPQFYRWETPYTPVAERIFAEAGEEIRDGLIWLFHQDERGYVFRQKYYGILNQLYVTNFYQKIYDWCTAHHCKLTGHSIEESVLFGQMWGGGAVMPTYEFEHIPAIDCLGRRCISEMAGKQASSVAAQLGKELVLTETFACSGYDVTPRELKSIGQAQYFQGVNLLCHHLYPFSVAGQGRIDHPPVFSRHGNWFEQFRIFNDYFSKLGCIIANTREQVDIAIVHPIREIWLEYLRSGDHDSVRDAEQAFHKVLMDLRKHGVTFQLVDEAILERHGSARDGVLQVGQCSYTTVLIPPMSTIGAKTYELLRSFTGKLCILGDLKYFDGVPAQVDLQGNMAFSELLAGAAVKLRCEDCNAVLTARKGAVGDFLFLQNYSMTEQSHIQMENVAENYVSLDLESMQERPISNAVTLNAGDSLILLRSEAAKPTVLRTCSRDITDCFAVTDVTENYLVLDYAAVIKEDGVASGPKPIVALFEELLREDYRGLLTVEQTFYVHSPVELKLILEKAEFLSVTVNGIPVQPRQSDFDVNFVEADISKAVQAGENVLRYSFQFWQHQGVHFALFDPLATESLRNCLYYDTSIEPAYLKGSFLVEDDLSISPAKGLPVLGKPLNIQGYPFFMGQLTMEGKFDWQSGRTMLCLNGRFLVAELRVNGQKCDMVLSDEKDITEYLQEGINTMSITLRSSLRNLFGPHHYDSEDDSIPVSPQHFHFRGEWAKGTPEKFIHRYQTVPFGVNTICLKEWEEEAPFRS